MNTQEETPDNFTEEDGVPAQEILQDRDVLMMEKPMPDNRAARYRPADKKLLRNIIILVLFLIAMLIVLTVIVRTNGGGSDDSDADQIGNTNITQGTE